MKKLFAVALSGLIFSTGFASEHNETEKENFKENGFEFSVDYWVAIPDGKFETDYKSYGLKEIGYEKAKDIGAKFAYKGIFHKDLNLVFYYTPIKFEADKEATSSFSFKEFSVTEGEKYESTYDFKNYDLGLLMDIGHLKEKTEDRLDIRAGISIRYLDGELELKAENGSEYKKDYSSVKPMLDLEAEVEVLPVNQDLTAEIILEYQTYIYNNEYLHDFIDSIRVNYRHVFAEFGYRVMKYKLKEDDIKTKTTAQGGFLSLGVMF